MSDRTLVYVRSIRAWRRPVMHALDRAGTETLYGDDCHTIVTGRRPYFLTACSLTLLECDVYGRLPDRHELCQPCAAELARRAQRDRQRRAPNRRAYVEATDALLGIAEDNDRA